MPDLPTSNGGPVRPVVAILCSDLHLCHKAPSARAGEHSWYGAMARSLEQLSSLQATYGCPVVIAGDVFDKWNAPAELINFALTHLPDEVYAIPGQHDLPYHNYDDIKRSAYWTLVAAGKIESIQPGCIIELAGLVLHGFPWGYPVEPCKLPKVKDNLQLAVVHQYIWIHGKNYYGAPLEQFATVIGEKLKGYDASVWGDNHVGFVALHKGKYILNSGGFMRRRSDEMKHEPSVGLLFSDGTIDRHFLSTEGEAFDMSKSEADTQTDFIDLKDFIADLQSLNDSPLDFVDAIRRYVADNRLSPRAKQILLDRIEDRK